jgi:hypothetical protein
MPAPPLTGRAYSRFFHCQLSRLLWEQDVAGQILCLQYNQWFAFKREIDQSDLSSISFFMSEALHAVVLTPNLIGFGNFPAFTPLRKLVFEIGIMAGIAGMFFAGSAFQPII